MAGFGGLCGGEYEEMIKGKNLILGRVLEEDKRKAFAYSVACSLEMGRDVLEVAGSTAANKEYVPGRLGWSVSCDCLLGTDVSAVEEAFREGLPISVYCRARRNKYEYRGEAIITSLRTTGRQHEVATYSIGMRGTGPLDYTRIPVRSCFGGGVWDNTLPWDNTDVWKN